MSQIAYLVPLVSIIIGLGLADLIQSFRELVRPDRVVRWHWLPVLWAAVVFLTVLQIWWTSFGILNRAAFGDVLVFLPYLLVIVALYLVCSFALPDPDWTAEPTASDREDRDAQPSSDALLDLKTFYFSTSHRRWFFGTLIAIVVLFETISLAYFLTETNRPLLQFARGRWDASVFLVGLATLIATDRLWVHALLSVVALGGTLSTLFFASSIGG
jgi:hypothetical protein